MHPPPTWHSVPVKKPPHAFFGVGGGAGGALPLLLPVELEPASKSAQVESMLGTWVQAEGSVCAFDAFWLHARAHAVSA